MTRLSSLGVARLAKREASQAPNRADRAHITSAVQLISPSMVKWEMAPTRAKKVIMNTLVPTAVFSS